MTALLRRGCKSVKIILESKNPPLIDGGCSIQTGLARIKWDPGRKRLPNNQKLFAARTNFSELKVFCYFKPRRTEDRRNWPLQSRDKPRPDQGLGVLGVGDCWACARLRSSAAFAVARCKRSASALKFAPGVVCTLVSGCLSEREQPPPERAQARKKDIRIVFINEF